MVRGCARPASSSVRSPAPARSPIPNDSSATRSLLRAELDAYYARLYGLTRKQLRYILDPRSLLTGNAHGSQRQPVAAVQT